MGARGLCRSSWCGLSPSPGNLHVIGSCLALCWFFLGVVLKFQWHHSFLGRVPMPYSQIFCITKLRTWILSNFQVTLIWDIFENHCCRPLSLAVSPQSVYLRSGQTDMTLQLILTQFHTTNNWRIASRASAAQARLSPTEHTVVSSSSHLQFL